MHRSHSGSAAGRSAAVLFLVVGLSAGTGFAGAQSEEPEVVAPLRAFVTSTVYTGALGGLAGADAKCQEQATAAALPNPTAFVAWLSDSVTDAYCHVHGFAGKRADDCGEAVLPAAAGPWVRVDGFPFADRIDLALSPTGRIVAPLNLSETGAAIGVFAAVWSGTNALGELDVSRPTPCSDWSVADGAQSVAIGGSWATTESWLYYGLSTCSSSLGLACLEVGAATPWPAHRSGGALAFVTSVDGTGDLGSWPEAGDATGLDAGDAICRTLAIAAGLPAPDTFFAWLSTGTVAAKDRLAYDGPWIRIDGVRIADSKADLTDGTLLAPVGQTESGVYLSSYAVWTGTSAAGVAESTRCGDWLLDDATQGRNGWANLANQLWTAKSNLACSSTWLRLYCFSDFPAVVFVDAFESSDTLAWSLTQTEL
jgi:hypothetical protein